MRGGSQSTLFGGPALAHELDQVRQGILVIAVFFGGQLMGPFIELAGHFAAPGLGTTE